MLCDATQQTKTAIAVIDISFEELVSPRSLNVFVLRYLTQHTQNAFLENGLYCYFKQSFLPARWLHLPSNRLLLSAALHESSRSRQGALPLLEPLGWK